MIKDRNIYIDPELGKINQGSIFYGGIAETYPNYDIWGIVITPRCDIANQKVPTYHYLPIVRYSDWVNNDFKNILYKRIHSQLIGELKSFLINNDFSGELVNSFSVEQIEKTLLPKITTKQKKEKLTALKDKIIEISDCISQISSSNFQSIQNKYKTISQQIIKELISNQNYNFYLLESWNNIEEFYVVLLRDIKCIKKQIFFSIGEGIMFDSLSEDIYQKNDIKELKSQDEMIYVETELDSPYIEHLMQMFFHNFGRIGIDDISAQTSIKLITKINNLL